MTTILILGQQILAVNPIDTGDEWTTPGQVIPKHVVEGARIVGADLPEDFNPVDFLWDGDEVVRKPAPPPPIIEPSFDDQVKKYDGIVQARIDRAASEMGYGDPNRPDMSPILHAITYAEEPAVKKFQAEGQLLRAWRSRYWAACWPILADARDGKRPVPTPDDLIAELDRAAPPPTPGDVNAKIAELSA